MCFEWGLLGENTAFHPVYLCYENEIENFGVYWCPWRNSNGCNSTKLSKEVPLDFIKLKWKLHEFTVWNKRRTAGRSFTSLLVSLILQKIPSENIKKNKREGKEQERLCSRDGVDTKASSVTIQTWLNFALKLAYTRDDQIHLPSLNSERTGLWKHMYNAKNTQHSL